LNTSPGHFDHLILAAPDVDYDEYCKMSVDSLYGCDCSDPSALGSVTTGKYDVLFVGSVGTVVVIWVPVWFTFTVLLGVPVPVATPPLSTNQVTVEPGTKLPPVRDTVVPCPTAGGVTGDMLTMIGAWTV
jgi:hypothetical protein